MRDARPGHRCLWAGCLGVVILGAQSAAVGAPAGGAVAVAPPYEPFEALRGEAQSLLVNEHLYDLLPGTPVGARVWTLCEALLTRVEASLQAARSSADLSSVAVAIDRLVGAMRSLGSQCLGAAPPDDPVAARFAALDDTADALLSASPPPPARPAVAASASRAVIVDNQPVAIPVLFNEFVDALHRWLDLQDADLRAIPFSGHERDVVIPSESGPPTVEESLPWLLTSKDALQAVTRLEADAGALRDLLRQDSDSDSLSDAELAALLNIPAQAVFIANTTSDQRRKRIAPVDAAVGALAAPPVRRNRTTLRPAIETLVDALAEFKRALLKQTILDHGARSGLAGLNPWAPDQRRAADRTLRAIHQFLRDGGRPESTVVDVLRDAVARARDVLTKVVAQRKGPAPAAAQAPVASTAAAFDGFALAVLVDLYWSDPTADARRVLLDVFDSRDGGMEAFERSARGRTFVGDEAGAVVTQAIQQRGKGSGPTGGAPSPAGDAADRADADSLIAALRESAESVGGKLSAEDEADIRARLLAAAKLREQAMQALQRPSEPVGEGVNVAEFEMRAVAGGRQVPVAVKKRKVHNWAKLPGGRSEVLGELVASAVNQAFGSVFGAPKVEDRGESTYSVLVDNDGTLDALADADATTHGDNWNAGARRVSAGFSVAAAQRYFAFRILTQESDGHAGNVLVARRAGGDVPHPIDSGRSLGVLPRAIDGNLPRNIAFRWPAANMPVADEVKRIFLGDSLGDDPEDAAKIFDKFGKAMREHFGIQKDGQPTVPADQVPLVRSYVWHAEANLVLLQEGLRRGMVLAAIGKTRLPELWRSRAAALQRVNDQWPTAQRAAQQAAYLFALQQAFIMPVDDDSSVNPGYALDITPFDYAFRRSAVYGRVPVGVSLDGKTIQARVLESFNPVAFARNLRAALNAREAGLGSRPLPPPRDYELVWYDRMWLL